MGNYSECLNLQFGALSDPTRREIMTRLGRGPASVGELKAPFSIALPNLLKHVRILEESGLIETHKQGRKRICSLRPDALEPAENWLHGQRKLMEAQLDRMEAYIQTLKTQKDGKTENE